MSSDGVEAMKAEVNALRGVLPKLRFPDFRDAGDWKLRELSELLTEPKEKNRQLKYGPEHVLSVSGEHGCVNQIDFMGRSYAGASVKEYNVVQTGDVVYTKSPLKACPNGIIKSNKGPTGIVSVLYAVYRPSALATSDFIDYYFSSDHKLNTYLQPLVKKGPKNSILVNNSDVLKGRIPAPCVTEQQKIADCLSSLDSVIAAERDRLAALREYKKGLMQQIFPRPERIEDGEKIPAETIPRLRFPEFREAGEWKETSLAAIGELVAGLTYSPNDVRPSGLLVLRSANIQGGKIDLSDCVYVSPSVKGANEVKPDDILICVRNGSTSLIGKSALIPAKMPLCTHGAFMTVFRTKAAKFIFQLFQTSAYQRQVAADLGATINSINSTQLRRYEFRIPSGPEQRRISEFLSAIDERIASQGDKLESLKAHNSALIQQLFPSPTEAYA